MLSVVLIELLLLVEVIFGLRLCMPVDCEFALELVREFSESPVPDLFDVTRELLDGRGSVRYGLFSRSVATPAMTSPFRRGGDLYVFSPLKCTISIVSCDQISLSAN